MGLIIAGLSLGMALGADSTPDTTDLNGLPEGRVYRDSAIAAGKLIANVEQFDVEHKFAHEKTLAQYAVSSGTSLGEAMRPDREVWVVSFHGSGTNEWDSTNSVHSILEVVLDKETGEVVAVTYRE